MKDSVFDRFIKKRKKNHPDTQPVAISEEFEADWFNYTRYEEEKLITNGTLRDLHRYPRDLAAAETKEEGFKEASLSSSSRTKPIGSSLSFVSSSFLCKSRIASESRSSSSSEFN